MKKTLLALIRLYQKSSFLNGYFFRVFFMSDRVCRFTPSCSEYTYQSIEKYGAAKGTVLGIKRIIRCHPLSKGGFDPVP